MKIMRKWRAIARYKGEETLVMCGKRKYRSGALGVRSRRKRSHGYAYAGNAMGKERERKNRKENAKWQ